MPGILPRRSQHHLHLLTVLIITQSAGSGDEHMKGNPLSQICPSLFAWWHNHLQLLGVFASQRISRRERPAVDVWQWAWQRVSLPDCGHLVGEQIMRLCVCRLLCEDHHVSVQSAMEPGNVRGPWVIRRDGVRVLETRQPKKGQGYG